MEGPFIICLQTQRGPQFLAVSALQKIKQKNPRGHGTVPIIRVEANRIVSDPDNPIRPHFCNLLTAAKSDALQAAAKAKADIRVSGKRPRDGYANALKEIATAYPADHQYRDAVQREFPVYAKIKPTLYRSYNAKFPVITALNNIPQELTMTLIGRTTEDPQDPLFQQPYLLLQQANPPFLVFGSTSNLDTLYRSNTWICDGTFQFRPSDFNFAQLYVVLGFNNHEAVPCIYALTPDRTQVSYHQLFQLLRTQLIAQQGNIGNINGGNITLDFERPAANAAQLVFPEASIKGCMFHYSQAVQRDVQMKGLTMVYQQARQGGYNAPQYAVVRHWIRRHIALPLLPPHLVHPAWRRMLSVPPVTNDGAVDANLALFSHYFEREWLPNQAKIDMFNHFDNDGPRTTNHAEGHNNGLRAKFDHPHPRLSVFLVKLQEMHHVSHIRCQQLTNGAQPAPSAQRWIQNDQNIQNAKLAFSGAVANLNPQDPQHNQLMDNEISRYLDYVQHLIG